MTGVPPLDRLRLVRYIGFIGSVGLAIAAYLGGAFPDSDLQSTPARILARPSGPACLAAWLTGMILLVGAWWLAGRGPAPRLRWVLVTAVLWMAPLALAPPSGSRDVYAYACQGAVYAAGADPYAVGPAALPCPWLDSISLIWRDTPAPYGPLYVAIAGGAVSVAGDNLALAVALLRLAAVGGVVLMAVYLPRLARACGLDEGRAVWLGLASPVVGIHLVSGAHNDALMVGFGLAGLVYAARRRPVFSGVWWGLALAVKVTAGIALPFAVLLAARCPAAAPSPASARPPAGGAGFGRLAGVAAWLGLGCVAAYAAVAAATGLGVGWLAGLRESGNSVQWTSVPTGVGLAVGYLSRLVGTTDLTAGAITVTRAVALGLLVVVLGALWWRSRRGDVPDIVHAAGLALLATVILAPVFHPWYWLWPLAVLAAAPGHGSFFSLHRSRRTDVCTDVAEKRGDVPGAAVLALVTAATAFLVLPDGYNLARATRLPGAFAVLAGVLVVALVTGRRRYWTDR